MRLKLLVIIALLYSTAPLATQPACEEIELPIVFDYYGLPTLNLTINEKTHNVMLDLGALKGIYIPKSQLNEIGDINYTGNEVTSSNISGDVVVAKEFVISALTINCLAFNNISGLELNPWAVSFGAKPQAEKKEQIIIGRSLFKNKILSINYPDKLVTIKTNNSALVPPKVDHKKFPLINTEGGITLSAATENKMYQMVLDTGSSNSLFVAKKVSRKEPIKRCEFDIGPDIECQLFDSSLNVEGYDFKSMIVLYPIDKRFRMDGLLGRDFFNQFIVELNFYDNTITLTPRIK